MSEDQSSRTEAATPRRREEARRKGQVSRSRDVQALGVLLGAFLGLSAAGAGLAMGLLGVARESFRGAAAPPATMADFHDTLLAVGGTAALAMLPVLAVGVAAGLAFSIGQTGPMFSTEAMRFKPERLDPIAGLRRLVSVDRLFEVVKALLTVVFVVAIAWAAMRGRIPAWVELLRVSAEEAALVIAREAGALAVPVLAALVPLALGDFAFQRFRYEKRLRMTKHEVKEELRQQEGDPQTRSRHRGRQRELSRMRMIAAVAEADVVVTNPTHYAVALKYDPLSAGAPEVLAKGRDEVAARIREMALRHGVPLVEDAPLARLLHKSCEVGRQIPEKLFEAVAEVLAHVYRLDPNRGRGWRARA